MLLLSIRSSVKIMLLSEYVRADLASAAIGVGNSHGPEIDKFEEFGLTAVDATEVGAPLIAECYANFE